jgi:hypothetical protein
VIEERGVRTTLPTFLNNLLRTLSGRGRGPRAGEIHVAVFGKHPGWDDHVGVGVDTERLAAVRQSLYVEGIAGNIDSGAWDRLEPSQRVAAFDHAMLWHERKGDVVVGRFWSSRDRKGRDRYPLVACAQCPGMPLGWVLKAGLPALERLKARCQGSTAEQDVNQAVAAAQDELRGQARDRQDPAAVQAVVRRLLESPELGEHHRGLLGLLYHVERYGSAPAAAGLRVPACADSFTEAAEAWVSLIVDRAGPGTSLLALQPLGAMWLDLILGKPTTQDLFCILARPAALPLTTDIPYSLEPEFIGRARAYLGLPSISAGTTAAAAAAPDKAATV